MLRSVFKIGKIFSKRSKKIEKFKKLFKIKKDGLPDNLLKNYFFYQFVSNFLALLLCKINVLDIYDMGDSIQIFFTSWNTEILIESNFWLGVYT